MSLNALQQIQKVREFAQLLEHGLMEFDRITEALVGVRFQYEIINRRPELGRQVDERGQSFTVDAPTLAANSAEMFKHRELLESILTDLTGVSNISEIRKRKALLVAALARRSLVYEIASAVTAYGMEHVVIADFPEFVRDVWDENTGDEVKQVVDERLLDAEVQALNSLGAVLDDFPNYGTFALAQQAPLIEVVKSSGLFLK